MKCDSIVVIPHMIDYAIMETFRMNKRLDDQSSKTRHWYQKSTEARSLFADTTKGSSKKYSNIQTKGPFMSFQQSMSPQTMLQPSSISKAEQEIESLTTHKAMNLQVKKTDCETGIETREPIISAPFGLLILKALMMNGPPSHDRVNTWLPLPHCLNISAP